MTDLQKETIERMRKNGIGYTAVALETELSKDSVKAYCRNHNLGGVADKKL